MMNRYLLMLCAMICSMILYGTSNQELFLKGNKAYRAGAYQEALDHYEQIAQKGDAVWHNMGNCYAQLKRPVDACVCWQRAQQHAVYDDYCTLHTQIAAVDQESDTMNQSWLFWVRAHTASYSLLIVQLITLLIWFSLFIAIKKRLHWFAIVTLMILSIFFIWLSIDKQGQWCRNYAVASEEIPVYVGPNMAYHQQGVVRPAHVVSITAEREGWYKIAYKELAGWVQADKLIKV